MRFKRSCSFALLALALGCSTTSESKQSQELLNEIRPKFARLRHGMRRSEVEAILKPKQNETGRINISGILLSHYQLTGDIEVTLWFHFPAHVKIIEDMEESPLSDDVLDKRHGTIRTYVGRGQWSETPLSQL